MTIQWHSSSIHPLWLACMSLFLLSVFLSCVCLSIVCLSVCLSACLSLARSNNSEQPKISHLLRLPFWPWLSKHNALNISLYLYNLEIKSIMHPQIWILMTCSKNFILQYLGSAFGSGSVEKFNPEHCYFVCFYCFYLIEAGLFYSVPVVFLLRGGKN